MISLSLTLRPKRRLADLCLIGQRGVINWDSNVFPSRLTFKKLENRQATVLQILYVVCLKLKIGYAS